MPILYLEKPYLYSVWGIKDKKKERSVVQEVMKHLAPRDTGNYVFLVSSIN